MGVNGDSHDFHRYLRETMSRYRRILSHCMGLSMNKEILLVAALFCVALFFATYHLTESPPVWYDEGFYVQSAANLAEQGHLGLQFAPGTIAQSALITVGYPLIYPLALWFQVFGADISSARFLMVVFILGFLAASYVLARGPFRRRDGVRAVA